MRNDTATAMLREQHRLILRVATAFERATADPATRAPLRDIEAFILFFRLFTDACHHGKEEDLLFAAMEDHGVGGPGGPIDAMREEHRFGRSLVRSMADALPRLHAGDAAAVAAFHRDAGAYIDFIRAHIAREDDGLFDMADNRIEAAACASLCDAYETVCRRRFEGLTLTQLERIAADLIDSWTADAR
jgi:hemerythrin-like domain-containing protein